MVRRPKSGNLVLNEEVAGLGVLVALLLSAGWVNFGSPDRGAGVGYRATGPFDDMERSCAGVVDLGNELGASWPL